MTKSSSSPRWLALEANPDVISNYAKTLGGPENISYHDVLSTESWALEMVPRPVLALLLVYPIKECSEIRSKELQKINKELCEKNAQKQKLLEELWFTKQTVSNACGTVALLHAFGNLRNSCPIQKGGYLETFYEKSKGLNPDDRAQALEHDDKIRDAHHTAQDLGQSTHTEKVTDHFVAFVDVDGHIVELDGRKTCPIIHDTLNNSGFLESAIAIVKRDYIDPDPTEIRFSIIALTKS